MSLNRQIKSFQRALARYGMFAFIWLFERIPYSFLLPLANFVLAVGYQFIIKQRRIAQESLTIAFGKEKSSEEIQGIVKACFTNMGRGMIEMFYFMSHPKNVGQKVVYEGREHLDKALAQGYGVIAVTAHFGNFPLMMLSCAQEGYAVSSIIRPARDKDLEKYLFQKRKDVGLSTVYAIPRQKCVTDSLKVLRNNEVLFIPIDQNFGSGGGVYVDFFGQKAATATGPIVFARRSKASIIPMFIVRQPDDTHKVIIEPPIKVEDGGSDQEMMVKNMSKITNLIEKYVRRYPHEWAWMHRRWKSRPTGKRRE